MTALRPWSGPSDTTAIQQVASRCWPGGPHPGGLGWAAATGQLAGSLVITEDAAGEPVGWAGVNQPDRLLLQASPKSPDVARELLRWLTTTAEGPSVSLEVFPDNVSAVEAVVAAGFVPSDASGTYYGHRETGMQAAVGEVTASVPNGYTVRSVRPSEADARVEVHRAAWRPADLPFAPDHRPVLDPTWTSSFDAERYATVRRTWLYDPALDLVVVTPDGTFVGCCLVWFDPATGWGEIEPLGIIPAHRGRGLAGALCAEAARRVAAVGGHHLFINTGASTEYPAPYGAYVKADFVDHLRSQTYSRTR